MSQIHDLVSENIIKNLKNVNLALENSKIESKVLTPTFTEKLEKLKNFVNVENHNKTNISCEFSPSFDVSDTKTYSRKEINEAFSRIRALPKEFQPPKRLVEKKTSTTKLGNFRGNLTRAGSLQSLNTENRSSPASRTNSMTDISTEGKPVVKVEELLEKIQENKKILANIKAASLKYSKMTENFGEERFRLAKEFKKALQEVTEMIQTLEQNCKAIEKKDVELVLDDELNELLVKFTKTIKDYNFLQKNSTIELKMNVNDMELEFPYSMLLDELKGFLVKYYY